MITATSSLTTAFISGIPSGTPDEVIHSILNTFGSLKQWRRLSEPSGTLKPSGFADFSSEKSLLSCKRLLPNIQLYQQATALAVKCDEGITLSESGEDGEVEEWKSGDLEILGQLRVLFDNRRMQFAVDSVNGLIRNYDHVISSVKSAPRAPHSDGDFLRREEEWMRVEAKIFREFSEYSEQSRHRPGPSVDIEGLFHANRKEWRRLYLQDDSSHFKQIADSIPTSPEALFKAPIDWIKFDAHRMRVWLVRQRGLLPCQADTVAGYLARRLSPEQIEEQAIKDGITKDEGFTIRLWRWILFDTLCN